MQTGRQASGSKEHIGTGPRETGSLLPPFNETTISKPFDSHARLPFRMKLLITLIIVTALVLALLSSLVTLAICSLVHFLGKRVHWYYSVMGVLIAGVVLWLFLWISDLVSNTSFQNLTGSDGSAIAFLAMPVLGLFPSWFVLLFWKKRHRTQNATS
jgi:hypothetical protein